MLLFMKGLYQDTKEGLNSFRLVVGKKTKQNEKHCLISVSVKKKNFYQNSGLHFSLAQQRTSMPLRSCKEHFSNDYMLALSFLPQAYYGSYFYLDHKITVIFQSGKELVKTEHK